MSQGLHLPSLPVTAIPPRFSRSSRPLPRAFALLSVFVVNAPQAMKTRSSRMASAERATPNQAVHMRVRRATRPQRPGPMKCAACHQRNQKVLSILKRNSNWSFFSVLTASPCLDAFPVSNPLVRVGQNSPRSKMRQRLANFPCNAPHSVPTLPLLLQGTTARNQVNISAVRQTENKSISSP